MRSPVHGDAVSVARVLLSVPLARREWVLARIFREADMAHAQVLAGLGGHPYWGDGSLGIPEKAPFDKIIVTAGAPVVPKALLKQLAVGGAMVIPVGDKKTQSMLRLTKKSDKKILKEDFDYFSFVPLLGKEGWE